MNIPSYDQLLFWCDSHGIVLKREDQSVRCVAYDRNNDPITTVVERVTVEKNKARELEVALRICDSIAEELLIVKPSVAFKLNQ